MTQRVREVAALIALGLLLGACTTDKTAEPIPPADVVAPSETTSTGQPNERNEMVAVTIDWHRSIEAEIARCMADRGFQYTPYVSQRTIDNIRTQYEEPLVEVQPGSDGDFWAPLFGVRSSPGSANFLEELLEGAREAGYYVFFDLTYASTDRPADDTGDDPNIAIVRSLTVEEANEYWRALQGYAAGEADGVNELPDLAIEDACSNTARGLVGPMPQMSTPFDGIDTTRLRTLGDEVFRAVHADPRMDAAKVDRIACLNDRGYPADPYAYIVSLLRTATEAATGDPEGIVGLTGHKEDDLARAIGRDRLQQLQAEEIGAATADIECLMEMSSVERRLITEYEQKVLDENPDIAAILDQNSSR